MYAVKMWSEQKQDGKKSESNKKPELPKMGNKDDQAVFDVYVDFFRLRNDASSEADVHADAANAGSHTAAEDDDNDTTTYEDLVDTFKKEKEELAKMEKQLNEMEEKLEAEESFVSYFITTVTPCSDNESKATSNIDDASDADDGISFTSMTSDLDSHGSSMFEGIILIIKQEQRSRLWLYRKVLHDDWTYHQAVY